MARLETATSAQMRVEQQHAEELVMAQSALEGERVVSLVRLLMFGLIGFSTAILPRLAGIEQVKSPLRMSIVGVYLAFCIVAYVMPRRVKKGNPKLAMWLPLGFIFIDAGFFMSMTWISQTLGEAARPDIVVGTFATLICFSVARVRRLHAIASTGVSIISVASIAVIQGWAHPVFTTFTCSCLLALGFLITRTNQRIREMFVEIRQHYALSRFLPPQVVKKVLSSNGIALDPVQREVTLLFSDIRSFTSMSESMPPKAVLQFLDDYFGHMVQIVRGHEGMLNKFLGDGLLAVWGVPEHQENHAERALRAAMDMRRKLVEINEDRLRAGLPAFKIGIGVHTGIVAAGMLGGAAQSEYTVIGDAVNLASRIESLTKGLGVDILASETTWTQGGRKFRGDRVGEEHVKGREAPVVIYAVREMAS